MHNIKRLIEAKNTDKHVSKMRNDIELHILQMNFVEFLTSFLEGRVSLSTILEVNERIYNRDHATLSQFLITVTEDLHEFKKRIDHGEIIDKDTINNTVSDGLLKLLDN